MNNQNWKDKGKGTISYLKVHLSNLFLMCKENRKIGITLIAFVVLVTVALFIGSMMEKSSATATVISSEEETDSLAENGDVVAVLEEALEKDAYPEVNNLIKQYYQALGDGDVVTIKNIKNGMDEQEEIIIEKKSEYIEGYSVVTVYTKKGPEEGSLIAYVHCEVKVIDHDAMLPSVNSLYICQKEDGSYFINEEVDQETVNYIETVTAHNDVIDLYNTVQVQYNEVLAADEELSAFMGELPVQLKESVSLALAEREAAQQQDEVEEVVAEPEVKTVVTKVKTTDVVNVRSSDSIEADRIGQTTNGQILNLLEEKVNGWSKVEFEGKEGYIKTEYLEPEETTVVAVTPEGEDQETETPISSTQEEDQETEAPASSTQEDADTTEGKVTDTVNVRKTASADSERLGQLSVGSSIEIIEKMSNGWTKIKYNDGEAYVKSDYVE